MLVLQKRGARSGSGPFWSARPSEIEAFDSESLRLGFSSLALTGIPSEAHPKQATTGSHGGPPPPLLPQGPQQSRVLVLVPRHGAHAPLVLPSQPAPAAAALPSPEHSSAVPGAGRSGCRTLTSPPAPPLSPWLCFPPAPGPAGSSGSVRSRAGGEGPGPDGPEEQPPAAAQNRVRRRRGRSPQPEHLGRLAHLNGSHLSYS